MLTGARYLRDPLKECILTLSYALKISKHIAIFQLSILIMSYLMGNFSCNIVLATIFDKTNIAIDIKKIISSINNTLHLRMI